jgi:hypothetical protein
MPQSRRPMIECIFGWGKQHGTMRKAKHRVICRVAADFMLNLIAYNLIPVSETRPCPPSKTTPNNRPHHQMPRPQENNQCCSPRISISRRRL